MTLDASYVLDAFLLMLGISIVLDIVVLVGTLRTLRIRKVRMLSGMALITIFVLVYLTFLYTTILSIAGSHRRGHADTSRGLLRQGPHPHLDSGRAQVHGSHS